ncbi:telomerase protein component 1 isoform X1 [Poecilia formosa]|uniref:telomerase protein component 1 isoform X1 n=1 Tax=Poecilia formosa TaxID=48698 RepID=UPI00044444D1|nr:PREDICTED: telomerase protein component 1 isoform X1 [Poecilia formosa]
MKALTLQQVNAASGSQTSNYCPPCLENKILSQVSTMTSGSSLFHPSSLPSLQPTSLSSTSSSSLLSSSSSISSPLLSTQNKLLSSGSQSRTSSFTSTVASNALVSSPLTGDSLLNRFADPPSFLKQDGEKKNYAEEEKEEISEEMQSSFEETSVQLDEDIMLSEEENDEEVAMETPVVEMDMIDQKPDDSVAVRQEEFPELDRGNKSTLEKLKDKKYLLLNAVCCSLVNKSKPPGQAGWNSEDSVWTKITQLAKDVSDRDPEFLLKVAVYTRQELNIRITTNFLLALAANLAPTKPHVRRYFCAAVQLPSDWLEIVRIYSTCFTQCLPTCLKKGMVDKFKQFSEYQLAKYNTRKHRCKHSRKKPKGKEPSKSELERWAKFLKSDPEILKKFFQLKGSREVVDKKQSEFSIKKLIKKLHIKEPAEFVMAILGKKYPGDAKAFSRSGIKGVWEPDRAGQRMKLKEPQTWERLISLEGNKAATWQKLIDSGSLPFMAMLRNLRNMITKGISEAHHKKILRRLTNQKAVIQSRQFPFRFLAAYKVILELRALASASQKAIPPAKEILLSILKKVPKRPRSRHDWQKCKKRTMKLTLGVPFIYRLYKNKKAQLLKAYQRLYSVDLLDRYRKALETAVQISCNYNVPPLPGNTILFVTAHSWNDESWSRKQDFCIPPDPEELDKVEEEEEEEEEEKEEEEKEDDGRRKRRREEEEHDPLTPTMIEVSALLALMIKNRSENCRLFRTCNSGYNEVELRSDVLLENARRLAKEMEESTNHQGDIDTSFLYKLLTKKNKVDNIITIAHSWLDNELVWAIKNYKTKNKKALSVNIFISDSHVGLPEEPHDRNHVVLRGFSEQILRFVAERGSSRLLDHVEHLDKLYNIPPPDGAKGPQTSNVVSVPAAPKLRWRGVRVFISSTFRDMHAERDVLVRSVFPELRRRAAAHCLHLQEVELRWGVTEEESERATALCLSEVCRSQMLVAILGERYGQVPPRPDLPDLPQYSWLASAPAGLSITEMEIRQFQALYPGVAQQRMFCYFRDPSIIKSVPVAWRSDFAAESKDAEAKLSSLKKRLLDDGVKATENYSCMWGGVVDGKPYVKKLEDFGKAVLEDLWLAVQKLFVEEDVEADSALEVSEQEVHQGALQRQFFGRTKLLSNAVQTVERVQNKGGMVVIEGGPGEGKTVFMAALADSLRTGLKSKTNLRCDVISYSTAASQSARCVENLLRCLAVWLRNDKHSEEESPLPHLYKDLLSEFHSTLSERKKKKPLVVLVDGVDLVQDGKGQFSSDWIPQLLPQGVCLVLSVASSSPLLQTLAKKKGAELFPLGQLSLPDKREIVQKELDVFGKKLSDSAFNNQLQTLITKKGAASPLYLHLACEDLKNFASFEKLKETLQGLPQSLSLLIQSSLERLCNQYRDVPGLRLSLAALTVSKNGLKERDLYSVLNTCSSLSSPDGQVSWEEVLQLSRKPTGRVPMAVFTRIVQNLQCLTGPSHCQNTDDVLALSNPEVKRGFEGFFLPTETERYRAHLVLAGYLWATADPEGNDTFLHSEADTLMHLPSSLIQIGQQRALDSLLSNYYFLHANVSHGLLHHLLETYDLHDKQPKNTPHSDLDEHLDDCRGFLRRHTSTLSPWPALFVQQALNEPLETSAHIWAAGLQGRRGVRVIECLNSNEGSAPEMSALVSTFSSEPTCVVLSPDKQLVVVGTGQGTLHFVNTQTGQEVKSLVSSCDGVSSCVFLNDAWLVSTSFDGRLEVWDVQNGCRTALVDGHTNTITASDITPDRKHLATVSLDLTLKVWSSAKANEVASLPSTSPFNCVTFDPEGHLLAAGCWNGNVIVWNWLQNKIETSLRGHRRSVRSLCFSPSSSSMLCSGCVSGQVRLWSVSTSTCVGVFQAHSGAAETLAFLEDGAMLLSAGSDHALHLWSGGLGRSVIALKSDESELEPPQKKPRCVTSDPAALCVAVSGDYAAVGYHGDGIKLFRTDSGEKIWASTDLGVSVNCLLWVPEDPEQSGPELLVSGGSDKHLRLWRKNEGEEGVIEGLKQLRTIGMQTGSILVMRQNSTVLASASDDFSIALTPLKDLTDASTPKPKALLRGHQGGITCLAFSPDGSRLLSGGKDQALMVWSADPNQGALLKLFPNAHRDWITGCAWTPDCAISSSNDGRLCFWDLEVGSHLKEISWRNPLTSVCCLGRHVIAGSSEGALHVWDWEKNTEICHISAHKQRINHCSLLPNADKEKETEPEELTVFTASDDGTVQLWKPLQVEHFSTFLGHSGAVHGVAQKGKVPEFLTVSEDGSLRCWAWRTDTSAYRKGPISALCFSQTADFMLAGYESGLLELWKQNSVVEHKQASDGPIAAACWMPDDQFAVSYMNIMVVDVWKLVWNQQHTKVSLVKVRSYKVRNPMVRLFYCSLLMGVTYLGMLCDVAKDEGDTWNHQNSNWIQSVDILSVVRNDEKSVWLTGRGDGEIHLGFFFGLGPETTVYSCFSSMSMKFSNRKKEEVEKEDKEEEEVEEEKKEEQQKGSLITAMTVDKEFVVCGDDEGNMWFNQGPDVSSWSDRKPAHLDRITHLKLTDSVIISASYDRTLKLWDRNTKKQVGMFVCGGPVLFLELNPGNPSELVCADGRGKIYFLSWKD